MKDKKITEVKEVKQSKKEKDLEKELKQTQNELSEIKDMLKKMIINQNEPIPKVEIQEQDEDYIDISPNKYIKVMSLTNHTLVLTTQLYGQGKAYVFKKFGEVKNIMYTDVGDIIHNQERFAREGKFYIMDKLVVRNYGLEQEYEKILDKKKLETILEFDDKTISSIFSNSTESQKNTITSLLISKIKNGENIDLNKIDVISKIYGKNIAEMAKPEEEIEE